MTKKLPAIFALLTLASNYTLAEENQDATNEKVTIYVESKVTADKENQEEVVSEVTKGIKELTEKLFVRGVRKVESTVQTEEGQAEFRCSSCGGEGEIIQGADDETRCNCGKKTRKCSSCSKCCKCSSCTTCCH